MERVTINNLDSKIKYLNQDLKFHEIRLESRYNYYALDLYNKFFGRMNSTLITGTKGKLMIYLLGIEKLQELKYEEKQHDEKL